MAHDSERGPWLDVTRPLRNGMIHWPGDVPFQWRRVGHIVGPGTSNLSEIHTSVHIGTHIDAPLHFIPDGADVDQIPLGKLCGPAHVVWIPDDRRAETADLKAAGILRGARVLLRTAGERPWNQSAFDRGFVGISLDAADWLVRNETPVVGIDSPSVDPHNSEDWAVHRCLLSAGIVIVEGLDLSAVEPGRYEMVALPLRIPGSDGSPARVILRAWQATPNDPCCGAP